MPSAQPYVFLVSGGGGQDREATVAAVQHSFDAVAASAPSRSAVVMAKAAVLRALRLDVENTEDAAHQLAFFGSIGALDALLGLPAAVEQVTADDVRRVASTYLQAGYRTVGWVLPGVRPPAPLPPAPTVLAPATQRAGSPPDRPAAAAEAHAFHDGRIAVEFSPASPTLALAVVLPGRWQCRDCAVDQPGPGWTQLTLQGLKGELPSLLAEARKQVAGAGHAAPPTAAPGDSPTRLLRARLAQSFTVQGPAAPAPAFLAVAGDVDGEAAAAAAQRVFAFTDERPLVTLDLPAGDQRLASTGAWPQAGLGYLVAAPGPALEESLAWELALYLFSHGYEGRFGKAAISERGLAYRIESSYRGAGNVGLITIAAGVAPASQTPLADLLQSELERLQTEPPDDAALAEAKAHLLGRRRSAAQSPRERASRLAGEWIGAGIRTAAAYSDALDRVTRETISAALDAFPDGTVIIVTTPAQAVAEEPAKD
jgi:predicted Zn-dependent peptidase